VIREFTRLAQVAAQAGAAVVPTPSRSSISSFCSYHRLQLRGGVPVGGVSLQDIIDFTEDNFITAATQDNDACCIKCAIDCDRVEPFFALVMTTKKLLSEFDSAMPIETDETFKVMHEGYALTMIGQSDMNRVWHVR
jgi:hypothetical protein